MSTKTHSEKIGPTRDRYTHGKKRKLQSLDFSFVVRTTQQTRRQPKAKKEACVFYTNNIWTTGMNRLLSKKCSMDTRQVHYLYARCRGFSLLLLIEVIWLHSSHADLPSKQNLIVRRGINNNKHERLNYHIKCNQMPNLFSFWFSICSFVCTMLSLVVNFVGFLGKKTIWIPKKLTNMLKLQ